MKKAAIGSIILFVLAWAASVPFPVSAASIVLTDSIKKDIEKASAKAERAHRERITKLYHEFTDLHTQDQRWDIRINSLHTKNEDALAEVRIQIKQIGAAQKTKLEKQLVRTKEQYKPLFAAYTSLNRQISLAKSFGNKELLYVLRSQAEAIKPAVQLARQDIRNKEAKLKSAKDQAAKLIKKIRGTLAGVDSLKLKIKEAKVSTSRPKAVLAAEWLDFKKALKKQDDTGIIGSFADMNASYRQINGYKQKIFKLEERISEVIKETKEQIPES